MPTINTATSQGGYLIYNAAVSFTTWVDLIQNTTNAVNNFTNSSNIFSLAGYVSSRGGTWNCRRGYLAFDTSTITGTLTALSLNMYVGAVSNSPDAIIQLIDTPNLSTVLDISDWQYINGPAASDPFYPSVGWMNIGLNANALSVAETENEISFVVRDNYYDYDYSNNLLDPFVILSTEYRYNYASFIPYLDYTIVTGYGQTVNGIIPASIGNVDGIAKASISKVLGV
jgi:hypothetical protein